MVLDWVLSSCTVGPSGPSVWGTSVGVLHWVPTSLRSFMFSSRVTFPFSFVGSACRGVSGGVHDFRSLTSQMLLVNLRLTASRVWVAPCLSREQSLLQKHSTDCTRVFQRVRRQSLSLVRKAPRIQPARLLAFLLFPECGIQRLHCRSGGLI